MTDLLKTALTWVEQETGVIKTEVVAIEPTVLAWAKSLLTTITPVIRQAATDAVMAAIAIPGSGAVKAGAALAAATADLAGKGIPVVESDLKAIIQIAYKALPASITGNTAAQAVVNAADNAVDALGNKVAGQVAGPTPAVAA